MITNDIMLHIYNVFKFYIYFFYQNVTYNFTNIKY